MNSLNSTHVSSVVLQERRCQSIVWFCNYYNIYIGFLLLRSSPPNLWYLSIHSKLCMKIKTNIYLVFPLTTSYLISNFVKKKPTSVLLYKHTFGLGRSTSYSCIWDRKKYLGHPEGRCHIFSYVSQVELWPHPFTRLLEVILRGCMTQSM